MGRARVSPAEPRYAHALDQLPVVVLQFISVNNVSSWTSALRRRRLQVRGCAGGGVGICGWREAGRQQPAGREYHRGALVSCLFHAGEDDMQLIHTFPLTKFPSCDDTEGKFIPICNRGLFSNGENISHCCCIANNSLTPAVQTRMQTHTLTQSPPALAYRFDVWTISLHQYKGCLPC